MSFFLDEEMKPEERVIHSSVFDLLLPQPHRRLGAG